MGYGGHSGSDAGVAVVFVWTDQLADLVTRSGIDLDASTLAVVDRWRVRPSAYRIPEDSDAATLALALLGLEPPVDRTESCACGLIQMAGTAS